MCVARVSMVTEEGRVRVRVMLAGCDTCEYFIRSKTSGEAEGRAGEFRGHTSVTDPGALWEK